MTDVTDQHGMPALRLVLPSDCRRRSKAKRYLPPEVLTNEEVFALMNACGRYTPTGVRNRALIAMLYRTGLRINEALCLFPKDLELGAEQEYDEFAELAAGVESGANQLSSDAAALVVGPHADRSQGERPRGGSPGGVGLAADLDGAPHGVADDRPALAAARGHQRDQRRDLAPQLVVELRLDGPSECRLGQLEHAHHVVRLFGGSRSRTR